MEENGPQFIIENNILKGKEVPHQIDHASLGEYVLEALEKNPDFVGQVDAITGEKYTYKTIRERSVRCALWMRSQGLLPGDVVVICCQNQLDLPIACYAGLYLGAAVSIWDAGLKANDFRHLSNLMKPKILFVGIKSANVAVKAAREASPGLKIISFRPIPGVLGFESIIDEPGAEEVKNFSCNKIEALDTVAMILCSSGTTGLPKGVALSHGTFLGQLYSMKNSGSVLHGWIVFTAVSWYTGTIGLFTNLTFGTTRIVVPSAFDEYTICALIEKFKPKGILVASGMVNRLLKCDAFVKQDLSCLKVVIYAGAALAVSSYEAFSKLIPNALIITGYGMTEVGGGVSFQTINPTPGSSGQISQNVQVKVIDPNTGEELGPNQSGELLLKTVSIMNYYYNDPKGTAEAVDQEGWFHSGDLGYYDDNGEIFVLERLKELIKYRGNHISPFQIESVILSHPGVKEVAVVGVPHPVDDEHPVAFVVRATDSAGVEKQVTETELIDLVAAELSDSKRLRGGVRFIDHLPKSPSEKARRKELRDLAKSTASNS